MTAFLPLTVVNVQTSNFGLRRSRIKEESPSTCANIAASPLVSSVMHCHAAVTEVITAMHSGKVCTVADAAPSDVLRQQSAPSAIQSVRSHRAVPVGRNSLNETLSSHTPRLTHPFTSFSPSDFR